MQFTITGMKITKINVIEREGQKKNIQAALLIYWNHKAYLLFRKRHSPWIKVLLKEISPWIKMVLTKISLWVKFY